MRWRQGGDKVTMWRQVGDKVESKWRQGGDEEDTEEDVLYVDNFF